MHDAGQEHLWAGVPNSTIPRGLGTYALARPEAVHWTEHVDNTADDGDNAEIAGGTRRKLITEAKRTRLLNQWGFHWKLGAPSADGAYSPHPSI